MILSPEQKIAYEDNIRKIVKLKGGKLEENWKYINSGTKINIICEKGHKWATSWDKLRKGSSS